MVRKIKTISIYTNSFNLFSVLRNNCEDVKQFHTMPNLPQQLKYPVWHSLIETHKKFAVTFDGVQFYDPAVCTFGAFFDEAKTAKASREYVKTTKDFIFQK